MGAGNERGTKAPYLKYTHVHVLFQAPLGRFFSGGSAKNGQWVGVAGKTLEVDDVGPALAGGGQWLPVVRPAAGA